MSSVQTIYLTKEQLVRFAGLSCDAAVGIQIHADARDDTFARYAFVSKWPDDPNDIHQGVVYPDGTHKGVKPNLREGRHESLDYN